MCNVKRNHSVIDNNVKLRKQIYFLSNNIFVMTHLLSNEKCEFLQPIEKLTTSLFLSVPLKLINLVSIEIVIKQQQKKNHFAKPWLNWILPE